MILSIVVFLAVIGLLIFTHELGHFITAKRSGVKVEEFGFGFPPRIFSVKRGETVYSLNLLPLGGFVKIYGEDGEAKDDPRSFVSKTILTKAKIIAAGVAMNFLLAIVLLSAGHIVGLPTVLDETNTDNVRDVKIQIAEVRKDSPAFQVGLKTGDAIIGLKIQEQVIDNFEIDDLQNFIKDNAGREITMSVVRGKNRLDKNIVPRVDPPVGEGALGIAMVKTGVISYPWYLAIWKGIESTFILSRAMLFGFFAILKSLIFKGALIAEVSGPVGIAVLTGEVAQMGFNYILQFTAILSINLAIINILPFPALDGGRLLFLAIEKIKGSPVNPKIEQVIHMVGFSLLILLMLVVTFKDIVKVF